MQSQLNRHAIIKNLALLLFMGTLSTTAWSLEENAATGMSKLQLMQEKKDAEQKAKKDAEQKAEDEAFKDAPNDINGLVEGVFRPRIELAKKIGCPNLSIHDTQYNGKFRNKLIAKNKEASEEVRKMVNGYIKKSCSMINFVYPANHIDFDMGFHIIFPMMWGKEDQILSDRKKYSSGIVNGVSINGTCEGMKAVEWYDKLYETVESYKSRNPDEIEMFRCGRQGGLDQPPRRVIPTVKWDD